MIDLLLLGTFALVTFFVAGEGAWGAAFMFVSVLISGLLAMNLFEPLANILASFNRGSIEWQHRVDIIALLGIFAISMFGLRAATDYLMPVYVEVHTLVYDIGRWVFAAAVGYLTMAICLTALHTAPLDREPFGMTIERPGGNLFDLDAPDIRWLAFVQFVSDNALSGDGAFDGNMEEIPRRSPPSKARRWSSFPMKYAKRREIYTAPAGANAPPPPPGQAAPGNNPGGAAKPNPGGAVVPPAGGAAPSGF